MNNNFRKLDRQAKIFSRSLGNAQLKAKWEQEYLSQRDNLYAGTLEMAVKFLNDLHSAKVGNFYQEGRILNDRKLMLKHSLFVVENFLTEGEKDKLSLIKTDFDLQIRNFHKQAEKFAGQTDLFEELLRINKRKGQNMILVTDEGNVYKGRVNIELDRSFNLHHKVMAEGSHFELKNILAMVLERSGEPIYFNEFLLSSDADEAYKQKFGEFISTAASIEQADTDNFISNKR